MERGSLEIGVATCVGFFEVAFVDPHLKVERKGVKRARRLYFLVA